jgi:hypothetical protein
MKVIDKKKEFMKEKPFLGSEGKGKKRGFICIKKTGNKSM